MKKNNNAKNTSEAPNRNETEGRRVENRLPVCLMMQANVSILIRLIGAHFTLFVYRAFRTQRQDKKVFDSTTVVFFFNSKYSISLYLDMPKWKN